MLNQTYQLAMVYNNAVNAALDAFELLLAPYIKEAITRVQQSEDYMQWLKEHPNGTITNLSSLSPNDWFFRIYHALGSPTPVPMETVWATSWLTNVSPGNYRPETLGWLLSGNCEKAAHSIYRVCFSPGSGYPPPPVDWIRTNGPMLSGWLSANRVKLSGEDGHGLSDPVARCSSLLCSSG